jgi:hypothetical protein
MTNTDRPRAPRPAVLRRLTGGKLPTFTDADSGRFHVARNDSSPGTPFEDSGYTVVDTARANILGHGHTNTVRVFELEDVRAVIDRVLHVEYLARLQRWIDAEDRRMGRPTVYERAKAAIEANRAGV